MPSKLTPTTSYLTPSITRSAKCSRLTMKSSILPLLDTTAQLVLSKLLSTWVLCKLLNAKAAFPNIPVTSWSSCSKNSMNWSNVRSSDVRRTLESPLRTSTRHSSSKPSGGFRLVTAFTDVGRFSKPQPLLMPDVDSTLRTIAPWKYIITSPHDHPCLLPDTAIKGLHEILRCSHSVSRHQSVYQVSHGNARFRDRIRGINVSRSW